MDNLFSKKYIIWESEELRINFYIAFAQQLEFRCVRSTNNEAPVERNRLQVRQLCSYRKK